MGEFAGHDPANDDLFGDPNNVDPYGTAGGPQRSPRGLSTFGGQSATLSSTGQFQPSSAEGAANTYNQQAQSADQRVVPGLNYGGAEQNFGNAMQSRNLAYGARNSQQDALGLASDAAHGGQPSQAQLLQQNTLDRGLKSQLAGAASAGGGPLGQMAAQRRAGQGAAAYAQEGANNIGALRAQETAKARDAYAQQSGAIRSQDLGTEELDLQAAQQHAQMEQEQGRQNIANRGQNAEREALYAKLGYGVREGEANRGVQSAAIEAENWRKQTDTNQQSKRDSQDFVTNLINAGGGFLGGLVGAAKGGPTHGEHPYLVGEKGPEIIVPRHDGYVMTADQTANIMRRAGGGSIQGMTPDLGVSSGPIADEGKGLEMQYGGGGQLRQASNNATQFQRHGGASPLSYGTRAGGGPVKGYAPPPDQEGVIDLDTKPTDADIIDLDDFERARDPYAQPDEPPRPAPSKVSSQQMAPVDLEGVNPYDTHKIATGGIIRENPYDNPRDPYFLDQQALDDRQAQTAGDAQQSPQLTTNKDWLERVAGPSSPNAQALNKEQDVAMHQAMKQQAAPAQKQARPNDNQQPNGRPQLHGEPLGNGFRALAKRAFGGPVEGPDADRAPVKPVKPKDPEPPPKSTPEPKPRILAREEGGAVAGSKGPPKATPELDKEFAKEDAAAKAREAQYTRAIGETMPGTMRETPKQTEARRYSSAQTETDWARSHLEPGLKVPTETREALGDQVSLDRGKEWQAFEDRPVHEPVDGRVFSEVEPPPSPFARLGQGIAMSGGMPIAALISALRAPKKQP